MPVFSWSPCDRRLCLRSSSQSLLTVLWCGLLCVASAPWVAADASDYRERWVPAQLPGCAVPPYVLLQLSEHQLPLIRRLDIQLMNLPAPDGSRQVIEGVVYYPLEAVAQLTFDEPSASLTFVGDDAQALCVSHVSAGEGKDYLLEVTVNREPVDEWTLAVMVDQQLLLPVTNLHRWRIRVPEPPYYHYEGEDYLPINRLRGAEYELNEQQLTLKLHLPSQWLNASRHRLGHKKVARAVRSDIGAFFNYDLNVENQRYAHKDDLTHRDRKSVV